MAARYFEDAAHAAIYAKFRRVTPNTLFAKVMEYLKKSAGELESAVDVGCGSGQSTNILSSSFKKVIGVDVSPVQIEEAKKSNHYQNVEYRVALCEELPFSSNSITLVTSGQACHWFDVSKFYKEAQRILKPGGVLAVYGYDLPTAKFGNKTSELSKIVLKAYEKGLWGKERKLLDDRYKDERFIMPLDDFTRIDDIISTQRVTLADCCGWIRTWSGLQNYRKKFGEEEYLKFTQNLEQDMLSALEVDSTSEDTTLELEYNYVLLMGRKS